MSTFIVGAAIGVWPALINVP